MRPVEAKIKHLDPLADGSNGLVRLLKMSVVGSHPRQTTFSPETLDTPGQSMGDGEDYGALNTLGERTGEDIRLNKAK